MVLLDLISRYITEDSVTVEHGVYVAFFFTLLFKYKFFEWWQMFFKLKDICYFCFCFWLSVPFCDNIYDLIFSTVVAKAVISLNIGV
jgi:hypothetical protein